jgi:thioredoxin 1
MQEPTRDEVDRMTGPVVLEFGADWCSHCQMIQRDLNSALAQHTEIRHIKVQDGKGKPLGRSFRVKLWPTLVLMRNSQLVNQLVRPSADEIVRSFEAFSHAG